MNNFKHIKKDILTPDELQAIICRAQNHDQDAIDELCRAFVPLIHKEAGRGIIYASLGEDAVNTAWEIFLNFIYKYKGKNFRQLPGLIQCHLRYELLHKIQRQASVNSEHSLEALLEQDIPIRDKISHIEHCENTTMLLMAIDKLTPAERNIILDIFFYGQSGRQCSSKYSVSQQTCHTYKKRALRKLKKMLHS